MNDWRIVFAETHSGSATMPALTITPTTVLEFDFRVFRTFTGSGGGGLNQVPNMPEGARLEIRAGAQVLRSITSENQLALLGGQSSVPNAWRAQHIKIGEIITGLPTSVQISFHAIFPTPVEDRPLWYQIDNIHVYDNSVYVGNRADEHGNIINFGAPNFASAQNPFFIQNGTNVTQMIYLESELGVARGNITHLVYELFHSINGGGFITLLPEQLPEFRIWMAHTSESMFADVAWIPFSQFSSNNVFTGRVPAIITDAFGSKRIVIELDEPFNYTGGNLAVMTQSIRHPSQQGVAAISGHQWINHTVTSVANTQRVLRAGVPNATAVWSPDLNALPIANETGVVTVIREHNIPNTTFLFRRGGGGLSVLLSTFSATHIEDNNSVNISWTTASETNLTGFRILRSQTDELSSATGISGLIGATNSTTSTTYNFNDSDVTNGQVYFYWLQVNINNSEFQHHGPRMAFVPEEDTEPALPLQTVFASVYPNPLSVSSTATFTMDVKENEVAKLQIFNIRGQLVREFNNIPAGNEQRVLWDLTDINNRVVPTGIYFYRLTSPSVHSVQRLVIMK
jgi:hypothetical protein